MPRTLGDDYKAILVCLSVVVRVASSFDGTCWLIVPHAFSKSLFYVCVYMYMSIALP